MQGMAGRDPEFHIRPLLFQITSLPCPAIHCSDDEDYQARARIMNKAITTMRRIMMMILIIMTKIMVRNEDDHDRDYSTPAVSDN